MARLRTAHNLQEFERSFKQLQFPHLKYTGNGTQKINGHNYKIVRCLATIYSMMT